MKGETALELDALVWISAFAAGIAGTHYGLAWSWWLAVAVGIPLGFLLYVPLWLVLIVFLRVTGLRKAERSEDVRAPHNLGTRPERRGDNRP